MQITVNETGAKTLADARPMLIDGQPVYVVVGEATASLIIGGRIVAEDDADGMTIDEAQAWAVNYRAEFNATVDEAVNPESVYAGAVATVRQSGSNLNTKADVVELMALTAKQSRRIGKSDPRHPVNAAAHYRRQAAVLLAWTVADEIAYSRYLDDGISDTDGYFTPETRQAWKTSHAA